MRIPQIAQIGVLVAGWWVLRSAPLHHRAAVNTLVYGRKRWFLAPPNDAMYGSVPLGRWVEDGGPELGGGLPGTVSPRVRSLRVRGCGLILVPLPAYGLVLAHVLILILCLWPDSSAI